MVGNGLVSDGAQILHTRAFRQRFNECLSRKPVSLTVVSPYIDRLPVYGSIVDFVRLFFREARLRLVTRPPRGNGCMTDTDAAAVAALGVDLQIRVRPVLHSKVYQFAFREGDRAAFIGSANFTVGGLERNDESMAMLTTPGENDRIAREIDRLLGLGSLSYEHWRVRFFAATEEHDEQA